MSEGPVMLSSSTPHAPARLEGELAEEQDAVSNGVLDERDFGGVERGHGGVDGY